jgi:aminomethyltransferase
MAKETKQTALHGWHTSHGANMADFGGYQMPLWYSSARDEHLAVLQRAGIFDTSHMAVLLLTGQGAHELLQLCFSNNLDACVGPAKKPLSAGRCVYGAFLDENGEVIDDSIVNKLSANEYTVVVNAGMGGKIAEHLTANKGDRQVAINDLTDMVGKIDVQGPMAAKILSQVLSAPETVFDKFPYFTFKGHFVAVSPLADTVRLKDDTPILLSRTGYTGEFGFEIFVSPEHAVNTWEMICRAGEAFGLTACGLAARDSLRGGAVLPLSHQDIGNWPFVHHPWPFALAFNADQSGFTKAFIGDKALLNAASAAFTYPFVGADLRKVATGDPAMVIDADGNEIGTVLTCVSDMGIGLHAGQIVSIASPDQPPNFKPRGLCCGFVKVSTPLTPGTALQLKDNRRKIKVTIVEDIRPDRTARRPIREML